MQHKAGILRIFWIVSEGSTKEKQGACLRRTFPSSYSCCAIVGHFVAIRLKEKTEMLGERLRFVQCGLKLLKTITEIL
eukprot:751621-Hanusia_phi.AAC.6